MSMDKFEEFVRSQGFQGEFQRTPNGQFKSDALHFMEKIWQSLQDEVEEKDKRIEQLQAKVDAVEHVLGSAMIAPKEVFQYADRIGRAL